MDVAFAKMFMTKCKHVHVVTHCNKTDTWQTGKWYAWEAIKVLPNWNKDEIGVSGYMVP
jgi:hypothetical protein